MSISPTFSYVGRELDHFRHAQNWKSYWFEQIREFLGQDVLEVGSGNGNNTGVLVGAPGIRLTALEPDPQLVAQHREHLAALPSEQQAQVQVVEGTLASLAPELSYDTLLYIDVLEHIEHDAEEARAAMARLRPGGRLIVLSPAFNLLYAPFDKALGHYRRYTLGSLTAVIPASLRQRKLVYLDSLAFLLSLGNRLLLRQSVPTRAQIQFWDGKVVPVSRVIDPLFAGLAGRSVLGVWEKS